MPTRRNKHMQNPYLRSLLADEVNALRNLFHTSKYSKDVQYLLLTVAYNCHGRTDQHIRHFGMGIFTGESEGAFPRKTE